jgi:hypothetical protein
MNNLLQHRTHGPQGENFVAPYSYPKVEFAWKDIGMSGVPRRSPYVERFPISWYNQY